jgi:hypothetical protein
MSTSIVHNTLNDVADRRVVWHSEIEYWGKYWENNWGCAARGLPCETPVCGVCGDDVGPYKVNGWQAEVFEGDISRLANEASYNDAYDAVWAVAPLKP